MKISFKNQRLAEKVSAVLSFLINGFSLYFLSMLVRFKKELHFLVSSPDLLLLLFFFTKEVVRSFEVELLSLVVLGLFQKSCYCRAKLARL